MHSRVNILKNLTLKVKVQDFNKPQITNGTLFFSQIDKDKNNVLKTLPEKAAGKYKRKLIHILK